MPETDGWDFDHESSGSGHVAPTPQLSGESSRLKQSSGSKLGRFREYFYQDGHLNRRVVFLAAPVVVFFGILFAQSKTTPSLKQARGKKPVSTAAATSARQLKSAGGDWSPAGRATPPPASREDDQQRTSQGLPAGDESDVRVISTAADPATEARPRVVSTYPEVAPVRSAPEPTPAASRSTDGGALTVRLRAAKAASARPSAEATAATSAEPEAQPDDTTAVERLRRGTRIRMKLLEPAMNGAAAPARAVVVETVSDAHGQVIIPAGTEAEVPFSGHEANGRLAGERRAPVLFLLKDAPELSAEGTLKGLDGRPGIAGRVKTEGGPNILRRALGASVRTATRALGSGVPGGYEAAGVISDGTYTVSSAGRRVVTVERGTEFIFVVGL